MSSEPQGHDTHPDSLDCSETLIRRADWISMPDYKLQGGGALYFGLQGSMNWRAVTQEPTYPLNSSDVFSLESLRCQAICGRGYRTLVSFGPGDGQHDLRLISEMKKGAQLASRHYIYIPVDISMEMLQSTVIAIGNASKVPVAIQCDFEQDYDLLASTIRRYSFAPRLYSMLGGTFANLAKGEKPFLEWLQQSLSKGDAILLDIPTARAAWTVASEPRLKANAYSDAFRRFVSYGIAQQDRQSPNPIEDRTKTVLTDFERRVRFTHNTNEETAAEEISVVDVESGRNALVFRRYRFPLLLQWLTSQGFDVEFSEESSYSIDNRFGMGVILLVKR